MATVHEYRDHTTRGNKLKKLLYINVYKLCNTRGMCASSDDLRLVIDKYRQIAREEHNVHETVVTGDFNDVDFYVPGLRELRHDKAYHRHETGKAKRFIDKVFTNVAHARIKHVMQSCENRVQDEENDLGHKTIIVTIGQEPQQRGTKMEILSLKALKKHARAWDCKPGFQASDIREDEAKWKK